MGELMILKIQKYSILKINKKCFKYKAVLLDSENKEFYYFSKVEFNNIIDCNKYINEIKLKETYYEMQWGKIIEKIPQKFDDFYQKLIEFFNLCEVGKAELNDWCKIRKLTIKLYEAKEVTKEEMHYLNSCISFHFKNQGRALELSNLLEKIKQKRAS